MLVLASDQARREESAAKTCRRAFAGSCLGRTSPWE
jgi:hypothetical protein